MVALASLFLLPTHNAYISEWYPDQNFGSSIALFTGRYIQPRDGYRSLLKFDLSSLPATSTINSAHLDLYMFRNETSPTGEYIAVLRLLNNWSQSTLTWNTQPPFNPSPLSPIWESGKYINSSTPLGPVSIDVTDLVTGWYDGSVVNNGLVLVGDESVNSLVGFFSCNHYYSTMWPRLRIDFTEGILNVHNTEMKTVPSPPDLARSTAIPLGPKTSATFMVWNSSASASVEAKIQVGFEDDPHALFFDAGTWESLAPVGTDGEAIVLSTSMAAEYSRVVVKGAGGEVVWIYPRTREL